MAFKPSAEQTRIFGVDEGGVIVIANAGTGKTTCTSHVVVKRYKAEQSRLFPNAKEPVTGADQRRILSQFLCLTFTVKAASELDERIKHLLKEEGIPEPKSANGSPVRIARTLDSIVRQWLSQEAVFNAWMASDDRLHARLQNVLGRLPSGPHTLHALAQKWPWLGVEDLGPMLLDLAIRDYTGEVLEGLDLASIASDFGALITRLTPDQLPTLGGFWTDHLKVWHEHQKRFLDLHHALKELKVPVDERVGAELLDDAFENVRGIKEEFMGTYEIARARGFHPFYAPEKLVSRQVEDQLASASHIDGYRHFLDLAETWEQLKTHFLLREFGDQTAAAVRAFETHPQLLQRDREYPSGPRRKYVFWDEVQDNSDLQHKILRLFYGKGVPFLTLAVGDPKQQIYCWRGASPRGFLDMIERKRTKEPEKLLGLTCSYRSAKAIVALGNEIITTLPSYREKVLPSTTIFEDEGTIEVTRPFVTLEEESEWIFAQIQRVIATTSQKIMVLSRSSINDHPLWQRHLRSHSEIGKRLSCYTIHRSKGLEADVVFLLGMLSGQMPDVRSNSDEEINLFYVACTRARQHLVLSGVVGRRVIDDNGKEKDEILGPSPFFTRLPTLKQLCIDAGWRPGLLKQGVDTHNQSLAAYISAMDKRKAELAESRNSLFPKVEVPSDHRADTNDYGVLAADPSLAGEPKLRFERGAGLATNGRHLVSERLMKRVEERLSRELRLRGRVPSLASEEFTLALRMKWIEKKPGEKAWSFSSSFRAKTQLGSQTAAA